MATGSDQLVGYGMVSLAAVIFGYYSIWVVILPFVDPDHLIHAYFLPRAYAVIIPIVAGLMVLSALGIFIGMVMFASKQKKKKS